MSKAPVPENEKERLAALQSYDLLDTLHEKVYDDLVKLAAVICGTPIALISLVDEKRQWFKANLGIGASETHRDVAFCAHTLSRSDIMEVRDATEDLRFHDNLLVTGDPKIKFYAGAPLKSSDGLNLGTLCVIDMLPRKLNEAQREALMILARQVEVNFELRKNLSQIRKYEAQIVSQYGQLKLLEKDRQELISLVVHDLKSPLAAIQMGSEVLIESLQEAPNTRKFAESIKSSSDAMLRLVMNVLDISSDDKGSIRPRVTQFNLRELVEGLAVQVNPRVVKRAQKIVVNASSDVTMNTDGDLIRRILENLVDNALKYAPKDGNTILIDVSETEHIVQIKVRDQGAGIRLEDRERVFQKYVRLNDRSDANSEVSRGLGLVFCRLAMEALGGSIHIEGNEPHGSVFCIQIPKVFVNKDIPAIAS